MRRSFGRLVGSTLHWPMSRSRRVAPSLWCRELASISEESNCSRSRAPEVSGMTPVCRWRTQLRDENGATASMIRVGRADLCGWRAVSGSQPKRVLPSGS